MPEKTMEEIIKETRKGKGPLKKILEDRRTEAQTEYEETRIRRLVEEERQRIRELKRQGQPLDRGLATDFTSRIFGLAEVDPEKAKAFLSSLDQENMNKLAYLMAMEKDRAGAFLALAKSSGTNVKDMVEIVKLLRGNGGTDLKGISEIFKAGVEAAKAGNPQGPATIQQGVDHVMKTYVNPFIESLKEKDKEVWNERFKNLESKIVNPIEWFTQQKAIAGQLGFAKEGKVGESDLKLEEMRQSHDLDMQRLTWEQRKYVMQQELERDKWGAIQQMMSPVLAMAAPEIRGALRTAGREVGRGLQGAGKPGTTAPQLATFTCPKCEAELTVPIPPNAPEEVPIKCPKCGTVTPAKLKGKEEATPAEEKSRGRLGYKMG